MKPIGDRSMAPRRDQVLVLGGLFAVVNAFMLWMGHAWFAVLPLALLVGWATVLRPDRILYLIAFSTPLSVHLEELDLGGLGVSLPTEPLMVALLGILLLRLGLQRAVLPGTLLRHPIAWVVLAQLLWMALCILPSTMPLVSLKYLLARCWFVGSMFVMVSMLLRTPRDLERFFLFFAAGLGVVVVYTVLHHAQFGFEHDAAHWVMSPFFKDHTSYGMALAFILPFVAIVALRPGLGPWVRVALLGLLGLLLVGLVLSYTRAAWLSLVAAMGVWAVMRLRIPFWTLATFTLVVGSLFFLNLERITMALERNETESSDDLAEHVSSMSNISTDASNLERINRWNSALRMFEERPLFGFGPGTYMFQYAPYQSAEDRTIISTNFGSLGNAHSEYLGPLAEQGLVGALLVVLLMGVVLASGIRTWSRMPPGDDRALVMAAVLGLLTYAVHGVLNNFLDIDKASVPFWAFAALLVQLGARYPAKGGGGIADPVLSTRSGR